MAEQKDASGPTTLESHFTLDHHCRSQTTA